MVVAIKDDSSSHILKSRRILHAIVMCWKQKGRNDRSRTETLKPGRNDRRKILMREQQFTQQQEEKFTRKPKPGIGFAGRKVRPNWCALLTRENSLALSHSSQKPKPVPDHRTKKSKQRANRDARTQTRHPDLVRHKNRRQE
jgi:hypothetical protein